jgi:capsular exopolysaccharide synthesis family protein
MKKVNNNSVPEENIELTERDQDGIIKIDVKRLLSRILQYWYLVLASVLVALSIAFFKNRYAQRIYPVSSSIIISTNETSEASLLYDNPLVATDRNYPNELFILRSYPLIQRVVEDLNLAVTFYREGDVRTTEVYTLPFDVTVKEANGHAREYIFKLLDDDRYELRRGGEVPGPPTTFNLNDTIEYGGLKLFISKLPGSSLKSHINIPFIFRYVPSVQVAGQYIGRMKVTWAERGASVVILSLNGPTPTKDLDFLNGLIRNYDKYDYEQKSLQATRAIEFITKQLVNISDSLLTVELQVERFKDKNVITNLSAETMRQYQKLENYELEKVKLEVRQNYYNYIFDYIQRGENLDQVLLPTSVGMTDPVPSALIQRMVELQLQVKVLERGERSENPLIEIQRRRIDELKKDIIEAVRTQQSTDKIQLDFLNRQIASVEKELSFLPASERQFRSIERRYNILENLYIFLMQKRAEADISRASTTSDIRIVNPPMISGGPISPKITQNYVVGALIGLGIPLLLFVLMEILNTHVQSRQDIEKITSIPFIGGLGHKRSGSNLEVLNRPKSALAESFRALRSNLNYFLGRNEKAVFLITSSISSEGKSFTSINLASVLSLSGKRTLIVGADMRRPRLFSDFGLENKTGLSSYLAGLADFESIVQHTSYEGLDLITGGPAPPNPSELLMTDRMSTFVEEARKRYDYTIIDSPPLGIVTDAFVLAPYADHTLFIIRQNFTPKNLLKTVQDFYSMGKLTNISIVFNDIYKSGPGYGYGYGYAYGYGYGYGYRYGYKDKKKKEEGYYDEE